VDHARGDLKKKSKGESPSRQKAQKGRGESSKPTRAPAHRTKKEKTKVRAPGQHPSKTSRFLKKPQRNRQEKKIPPKVVRTGRHTGSRNSWHPKGNKTPTANAGRGTKERGNKNRTAPVIHIGKLRHVRAPAFGRQDGKPTFLLGGQNYH